MEKGPKVGACYCCVFDNPNREQESPASQEARLAGVAESKGLVPEIFVEEDCFGIGIERPGLQNLIKEIQIDRISMVLVTEIGRLTRRVRDMRYLLDLFEKHDVVLVSLDDAIDTAAPDGRTLLKIMVTVARLEGGEDG